MSKIIVCMTPGLPYTGAFLESYDPEYKTGVGRAWWTDDFDKAKRFATAGDAMKFWKQESKTVPLRHDGKPNRPLTAFSINIVDEANAAAADSTGATRQ